MYAFLGKEQALGGKIKALATANPNWYVQWPAVAADVAFSWALFDDALGYLKPVVDDYRNELMRDAASLPPAKRQAYLEHVNMVLFNAVVEATLISNAPGNRPLFLTVQEAKDFFTTLMNRRGYVHKLQNVRSPLGL